MSKAYKVVAKMIPVGERKGETVYTVSPVSYGLLTTDEVAKQISTECTATPADVKAVLDRYAYYVKENIKKGYDVELLGFGTLTIRFIVSHSVDDAKLATSKIVSSLMPAFRPSYTMHNGTRIYNLIPDKVSLVKYGEDISTDEAGTTTPSEGGSTGGGNEEEPPVLGGEDEGGSGGTGTDEPDITVGEEEGGEIGE
ncbi:MAG: HU family DNA-binding protein [Prevotellaceae bacterium]|nr:HU family DNA-binding protein [Prevotellaceae bacterium]